ncbi:MAG: 4Fe-4S binding protein [Syntrophomonadaceae bacterium]|nr:4Fe-4S binding protein [Syntrophomonadaceae bacterium]
MNKQDLIDIVEAFVENSEDNYIGRPIAISEQVVGMKIFEKPIMGIALADDALFTYFKTPSIIGQHFMLPHEWLPEAKTVISFFLPFSEAVKKASRKVVYWPSAEWLHGRIEGQSFINKLCLHLQAALKSAGYNSLAPSLDRRFWANTGRANNSSDLKASFSSNWSERHVAFVCGLGTFGLSKGLITSKGIAGRFGSLLTNLCIPPDPREYERFDEYCTMCGICARNCPVNAISIEKGKNHELCSAFLDRTAENFEPRYGCGKCQTKVPCESKIPKSAPNMSVD